MCALLFEVHVPTVTTDNDCVDTIVSLHISPFLALGQASTLAVIGKRTGEALRIIGTPAFGGRTVLLEFAGAKPTLCR